MKRFVLAAGLMVASFCAQPAMAATFIATYSGNITAGYDPDNYFGIDDSLTNAAVQAIFTFNTTGASSGSSASSSFIDGVNISSAKILINGVAFNVFGAGGATVLQNGAPDSLNQYVAQLNDYGPGSYTTAQYLAIAGKQKLDAGIGIGNGGGAGDFLPSALLNQYTSASLAGDAFGHFTFVNTSGSDVGGFEGYKIVQGFYKISDVTIAGVPEPQTWAMMVIGLAGVGAALRTRRRNQANGALVPAAI